MGQMLMVGFQGTKTSVGLLKAFPALILTYGYDSASISAGLKTAFGLVKPGGYLPFPVKSAAGELLFAPGYGLVTPKFFLLKHIIADPHLWQKRNMDNCKRCFYGSQR